MVRDVVMCSVELHCILFNGYVLIQIGEHTVRGDERYCEGSVGRQASLTTLTLRL